MLQYMECITAVGLLLLIGLAILGQRIDDEEKMLKLVGCIFCIAAISIITIEVGFVIYSFH